MNFPGLRFCDLPLLIFASRYGGVCREEKAELHQLLNQFCELLLCRVLVS